MSCGRIVVAGAEFALVVRWHGRSKPSFREKESKNYFSGWKRSETRTFGL